MSLTVGVADRASWPDVVDLFGENGAYANCWCTWWFLSGRDFEACSPGDRKSLMRAEITDGREPGLLAYDDGVPVGWVAVGPRERYARMMSKRARIYGPPIGVEGDFGWVVNCFFVRRTHRDQGVARSLLHAAVEHAFSRGASFIIGHPVDVERGDLASSSVYVGTVSMFEDAGFTEIERRGNRPVMRLDR